MIILLVSLMHFIWGLCVLYNQGPLPIAATWAITQVVGLSHWKLRALLYIGAALLPAILWRKPSSFAGLLSVIPQQALLILSGISALSMIVAGHYADGVVRPHQFIAMDQILYLLLAFFHATNVIDRWTEYAR